MKRKESLNPLDTLLEQKGIDRKTLAKLSGVSYGSIESYALGRRNITFKNAAKLCKAMDCSFKELAIALGIDVSEIPSDSFTNN